MTRQRYVAFILNARGYRTEFFAANEKEAIERGNAYLGPLADRVGLVVVGDCREEQRDSV